MGNLNVGRGGEPNAPTADSHERALGAADPR